MGHHACYQCGRIAFKTIQEYEMHQVDFHGVKIPVKAVNDSGRTRFEIVKAAETGWLNPFLLESKYALTESFSDVHLPACMCHECLAKKINDMMIVTQRELAEIKKSITMGA